jgi:hypothetical protein
MTISIKNCNQKTNKAITAMRRGGRKKEKMTVIQLKGKKKSCEKRNKYLKKMYTNVKDEAHGNNRQPKNCH